MANKKPKEKQGKKGIISRLFDSFDRKLVEKSKKKQCSCCAGKAGKKGSKKGSDEEDKECCR